MPISPTTVRVPVFTAHSVAVNVETEEKVTVERARELFGRFPGLRVVDDPGAGALPDAGDGRGPGRLRRGPDPRGPVPASAASTSGSWAISSARARPPTPCRSPSCSAARRRAGSRSTPARRPPGSRSCWPTTARPTTAGRSSPARRRVQGQVLEALRPARRRRGPRRRGEPDRRRRPRPRPGRERGEPWSRSPRRTVAWPPSTRVSRGTSASWPPGPRPRVRRSPRRPPEALRLPPETRPRCRRRFSGARVARRAPLDAGAMAARRARRSAESTTSPPSARRPGARPRPRLHGPRGARRRRGVIGRCPDVRRRVPPPHGAERRRHARRGGARAAAGRVGRRRAGRARPPGRRPDRAGPRPLPPPGAVPVEPVPGQPRRWTSGPDVWSGCEPPEAEARTDPPGRPRSQARTVSASRSASSSPLRHLRRGLHRLRPPRYDAPRHASARAGSSRRARRAGRGPANRRRPQPAIDPDESQHLHVAWLIAQGQVPYRDFWEHHLPFFHYAMAPLTAWLAERPEVYFAARGLDGGPPGRGRRSC